MVFFPKLHVKAILYVQFCCFSTVCLLLSRVNHRYQILIIELKLSLKIALRQNLRVTSRAGMAHSVRVYIVLHTPSEHRSSSLTNACYCVCKLMDPKRLSCHAGHQEVSRCHTRGEAEELIAYR